MTTLQTTGGNYYNLTNNREVTMTTLQITLGNYDNLTNNRG